jgi:hypothetical protein
MFGSYFQHVFPVGEFPKHGLLWLVQGLGLQKN